MTSAFELWNQVKAEDEQTNVEKALSESPVPINQENFLAMLNTNGQEVQNYKNRMQQAIGEQQKATQEAKIKQEEDQIRQAQREEKRKGLGLQLPQNELMAKQNEFYAHLGENLIKQAKEKANTLLYYGANGIDRAVKGFEKINDTVEFLGMLANPRRMLKSTEEEIPSIVNGMQTLGMLPEITQGIQEGVTQAAEQSGYDPTKVPIPGHTALARMVKNYTDSAREFSDGQFDAEAMTNRIVGIMTEESLAFIPTLTLMAATGPVTAGGGVAAEGAGIVPKVVSKAPTLFTKLGIYSGAHAVTQEGNWDDHLMAGAGFTFFGFVNSKTVGLSLKQRIGATIAAAQGITSANFLKSMGEDTYKQVFEADEMEGLDSGFDWEGIRRSYIEESLVNIVQGLGLLFTERMVYPRNIVKKYLNDKFTMKQAPSVEGLLQERMPMLWDKYTNQGTDIVKESLIFQQGKFKLDLGEYRSPDEVRPYIDDLRKAVAHRDEDPKEIDISTIKKRLAGGKDANRQTKAEAERFVNKIVELDSTYLVPKAIKKPFDPKKSAELDEFASKRINRTKEQIDAYAGVSADEKLMAPPVEIPLQRKAYKAVFGDDFEALILSSMKGKMDPTTKALIIEHYIRPTDNTPHEIALLEKDLGWTKAEYVRDKDFNAEFGTWWEAYSEINHHMTHRSSRGKKSEYPTEEHAIATAQKIWNKWSPEQRIRAERSLTTIDNFIRGKLQSAVDLGILDKKVLDRIHPGWKPRINTEMIDHIAAQTTHNDYSKAEQSSGKYTAETPLKSLSENPEVADIHIISDPLLNLRVATMDINTSIERNAQAKRLHTWIKEHPEEAKEINFYTKRPNSRGEWKEVLFNNPKGKNGKSSIWMTRHDYDMLGYEHVVSRDSKLLNSLNDGMTFMKHLTTKNEITFAMRRWLADTRNTVENVRLPMPMSWKLTPGFESKLALKQGKYVLESLVKKKKGSYKADFDDAIKNGLLLTSRGEYQLKGYKDLSKEQLNILVRNIEGVNGSKRQTVMKAWDKIVSNPALKWVGDVTTLPQRVNDTVHQTASVAKYAMFRDYLAKAHPEYSKKEIAARLNEHQDFKTHGDIVAPMENVIWFTNPMLRDIAVAWRNVRRSPKEFVKIGMAMMPAIATHEVMMSISNPAYREIGIGKKVAGVYVPMPGAVKEDKWYKMPSIRLPLDNFGKPIVLFNFLARLGPSLMINELVKSAHNGQFSPEMTRAVFDAFGPKVIEYDAFKDSRDFVKDVMVGGLLNQVSRVNPIVAGGIIGMTKVDPFSGKNYGLDTTYLTELGVDYDPTKVSRASEAASQYLGGLVPPAILQPTISLAEYNTITGNIMRYAGNDPRRTRQDDPATGVYHELSKIAPFNMLLKSVSIDNAARRNAIMRQNTPYIQKVVHPMLNMGDEMQRGNYERAREIFAQVYESGLAPIDRKMVIDNFKRVVESEVIYSSMLDYVKQKHPGDYMAKFTLSEDYRQIKDLKQDLTGTTAADLFLESMQDKNTIEEKAMYMIMAKHGGLFSNKVKAKLAESDAWKEESKLVQKGLGMISKDLMKIITPKYKEQFMKLGDVSKHLSRDLRLTPGF